jgi:hypothetical protein
MLVSSYFSLLAALGATSIACNLPSLAHQFSYNALSWLSQNETCLDHPDVYIVRPSAGKGLGVFANKDLELGAVILSEAPIIKIRPPEFRDGVGYPLDAIEVLVREAFDSLSKGLQAEVLSLHAYTTAAESQAFNQDQLLPIFRSNAYNTGEDVGLFPRIARINHSCRPNTSYYWNPQLNKRVVYATRHIEKGEELSVTYIPLLYSQADRQKRLDQYGFKCTCTACSKHGLDLHSSDDKRQQLRQAFQELTPELTLDLPGSMMAKKKAQKMVEQSLAVVRLVEEEQLADYYAQAYRMAAITHARISQWEPATLWAHKSMQIRNMADKESEEAKEMEALTYSFISKWEEAVKEATNTR